MSVFDLVFSLLRHDDGIWIAVLERKKSIRLVKSCSSVLSSERRIRVFDVWRRRPRPACSERDLNTEPGMTSNPAHQYPQQQVALSESNTRDGKIKTFLQKGHIDWIVRVAWKQMWDADFWI